jgi:hypothetical protein
MAVLVPVAFAVAIVSAIRGIWSPCGLSMLSSITPMTESGRGHRFATTAAWFVVGSMIGGLTLGIGAAAGAAGLAATGASLTVRLAIGAIAAALTASIDLGALGIDLPIFKRQVNDAWLRRYRGWVYGAGFGWQIGVGVATYIMTAGVLLTVALAVLGASPLLALVLGLTFGLVRGCGVYIGRSGTDPASLGRIHERLEHYAPTSRFAAAAVQVVAASALAGAVHPVAGIVVGGIGLAALVAGRSWAPAPAGP